MYDYNLDEYENAIEEWARYCKRKGRIYQQPSKVNSTVERDFVYLRNSYRLLAVYDLRGECIVEQ